MNKSVWMSIWVIVVILLLSPLSGAGEIIFHGYSYKVSQLELQLEIFDLKVNYFRIISKGPLVYLSSISSRAASNKEIRCCAYVDPTMMIGTIEEKKNRLKKFCKALFNEYRDRFFMIDIDYVKRPGEFGIPAVRMKQSNLKIFIYTAGADSKFLFLAEWDSGHISYKDGFLSTIKENK